MYYVAFLLTVLTNGGIDYLPGAIRPWVVDFSPLRKAGRGYSLLQALWNHWS